MVFITARNFISGYKVLTKSKVIKSLFFILALNGAIQTKHTSKRGGDKYFSSNLCYNRVLTILIKKGGDKMKKEIIMPSLSLDMEEGTIISWFIEEGEKINEDDEIAEIETDKASTIIESSNAGTITKIVVEEGETVDVGEIIAWIEIEDE